MRLFRFLGRFATAMMALVTLTSSAVGESSTLRVLAPPTQVLNPFFCVSTYCTALAPNFFDTLVRYESGKGIVPAIAEGWEISDNNRNFRFVINPDARWSDGTPITASSIVNSFDAARQLEGNALSLNWEELTYHAETSFDGKDILVITSDEPLPELLFLLVHATMAPLPVHSLTVEQLSEGWPPGSLPSDLPMSGPFRLQEQSVLEMHLVPNEHYYDASRIRPSAVHITFPESTGDEVVPYLIDFTDDAYDLVMPNFRPQHVKFLAEQHPTYFLVNPQVNVTSLAFNHGEHPFDKIGIRQAVSFAVPNELPQSFLDDYSAFDATSMFPPGFGFERVSPQWQEMPYDVRLERARSLMQDHGYSDENRLEFRFNIQENAIHERLAQVMQGWFSQIYIDMEIVVDPWSFYLPEILRKGEFQLTRRGRAATIGHPLGLLGGFGSESPFNYGNYQNAEYDAILAELRGTQDPELAADLVVQAQNILQEDFASLPLYHRNLHVGVRPGIEQGALTFQGAPYLFDVSRSALSEE